MNTTHIRNEEQFHSSLDHENSHLYSHTEEATVLDVLAVESSALSKRVMIQEEQSFLVQSLDP